MTNTEHRTLSELFGIGRSTVCELVYDTCQQIQVRAYQWQTMQDILLPDWKEIPGVQVCFLYASISAVLFDLHAKGTTAHSW